MIGNITKIVLSIVFICLVGCATSNPSADTNETGYATNAIPANFGMDSSSLLDDVGIYYRVQVFESKEANEPDKSELIFQIRPGSDKVYLRSRSLYITANGETFEWPGREWQDISDAPEIKGTITAVNLGYDDLVTIAEAAKVEGNLGGQTFDWPYESRETIRQFIAQVNAVYQK